MDERGFIRMFKNIPDSPQKNDRKFVVKFKLGKEVIQHWDKMHVLLCQEEMEDVEFCYRMDDEKLSPQINQFIEPETNYQSETIPTYVVKSELDAQNIRSKIWSRARSMWESGCLDLPEMLHETQGFITTFIDVEVTPLSRR